MPLSELGSLPTGQNWAVILPLLAMTILPTHAETTLYIGIYTDPAGSKGIYRVGLNPETGALSQSQLAAETTAPSYLVPHPNGKFLYAVNEYSGGEASAFAIEKDGLRKLNTVQFDGGGPCHICTDPGGKWLFVSAYGGGTLAVLPINADGQIGEATDVFRNQGSGPNKGRQEAPHMHFAASVGGYVYACDLGTDEVLTFRLENGKLSLQNPRAGKTEPGAGPRHFAVHPNGKTLYANNEMTLGVSVFDRNPDSGQLQLVQTLSTLPEDEPMERKSTAAIRLHPKLPVLYVSNRGHDSLVIFDVQPDGKLKRRSMHELGVKEPRDFVIDPSGKWLIAAGQKSGDLATFRIDPNTGTPTPSQHRVQVPKPVCIAFAP